jgi:hypothetical protein
MALYRYGEGIFDFFKGGFSGVYISCLFSFLL